MGIEFSHQPVMLDECIEGLDIKKDGLYADCTAGGGGHSEAILKAGGRVIAIDQDSAAIAAASERLKPFGDRVKFVHDNFVNAEKFLFGCALDGALIDLGVSSYQLDTAERGFSYNNDAPLDMRMNRESSLSAYDVVNGYTKEELTKVIYRYGEERFAGRIAQKIVDIRAVNPISTTLELSDIIKSAIPSKFREGGHHPAKKAFQAIRIEVNHELDVIEPAIRAVVENLKSGGRFAVITFHSLEDRIVKQAFASLANGCTCPPDFPVCVCGNKPVVRLVTRKPLIAGEDELERNPRARSAKLRVVEKL